MKDFLILVALTFALVAYLLLGLYLIEGHLLAAVGGALLLLPLLALLFVIVVIFD